MLRLINTLSSDSFYLARVHAGIAAIGQINEALDDGDPMKTLAMLQNPSAKLTDVDPSVAQHYHDKLLEARREKAHVSRPAVWLCCTRLDVGNGCHRLQISLRGPPSHLLLSCVSSITLTLCKRFMQTGPGSSYIQTSRLGLYYCSSHMMRAVWFRCSVPGRRILAETFGFCL